MLERRNDPERQAKLEEQVRIDDLSAAGLLYWRLFQRLSHRRTSNGYGPNPITWHDIEAFSRVTGLILQPAEVEIIEQLDGIFLSEQAKQLKAAMAKT